MFINFSNHPSENWSEKQKKDAETYGEILDIPFPEVDAGATEKEIMELAEKYARQIIEMKPDAVMCQGEFTLSFAVVSLLKQKGINVLAACSERIIEESYIGGKHIKKSEFKFVRFRRY